VKQVPCRQASIPKRGKSTDKKGEILRAASWLFRNKGFLRTSLNDIASRVGINKATIFYYFHNKDYLLYEVLCESLRSGIKEIQHIMLSSSPEERLKNVITVHLRFNIRDSGFGGISAFEQKNMPLKLRKSYIPMRDEYEGLIRETMQGAMVAGQIKQGDVRVQTRILLGALNSVNRWFKQDGRLSIEDVADAICKLISCGRSPEMNDDKQAFPKPL